MAEYKKKTVKKLKNQKPKKSAVADNYKVTSFAEDAFSQDISMKSAKEAKAERRFEKKKEKYLKHRKPEKRVVNSGKSAKELNRSASSLRVLKGTKKAKRIKSIIALLLAVIIIVVLFLVHISSPTGLTDLIKCSFARRGSGSGFPITLSGGTVEEVDITDGCITVLSDTYIEMYNVSSKELVSEQHKYSSPKLQTSKTRALIFDQGAEELSVYDITGKIFSRDMKEPILTASIGRNGTYAVVTDPEDIAAKVYVYNKNNSLLFDWESKSDLVNSVSVSNNGKYVVVSTVNAKNGEYSNSLKTFNTKSKEIVKDEPKEELIYSVESIGKCNFVVRTESGLSKLNASDGTFGSITESSVIQKYVSPNGEFGLLTVSGSENKFILYNSNFEVKREMEVISSPKFIVWNDKYVVCVRDYSIYVYDAEGKEVNKISTSSPVEKAVTTNKNILAINNSTIVSYDFVDASTSGGNQ